VRVLLISNDRRMYSTCRKVLVNLRSTQWDLTVVPRNPPTDGDLYIWDYESDPTLRGSERVMARPNIFFVQRENLAALRAHFSSPPVWTLLKPLNPAMLESVLADPAVVSSASVAQETKKIASTRRDRDDLLEALLECNLFLQQNDQIRSDMFAQGIRELRTPLMASLGYCRLLLDQQLGTLTPDQQKVIQRMQQSTQRLLRLATSMFQSTLGVGGKAQPRFQVGDIEECIERAVVDVNPFVEARNLLINRKIIAPQSAFTFDPEQLTQLLANILDHAVRFTPRGGQINIRTRPVFWDRRARNISEGRTAENRRADRVIDANAYRVEVQDPGPAIRQLPVEDRFEPGEFDPLGGGNPGADFGFGLAMCQQIIEMHRGRIVIDGVEAGYFAFEIPLIQDLEAKAPARSQPEKPMRIRA